MSTPATRHFLNALRPNRQLPAPTRGNWHQESEFLQKYANDIDIQGQLSSTEMSHSVPSFFQRPIQFYRSLANANNPLHDAVTSEWRGLMAVFALSSWRNLELETRYFAVPPAAENATSIVGATGNGSLHLDTILRNQAPNATDWNGWWMIYCGGKLLGATSPWTVVYTGAQYTPSPTIPWQRNGLLIDPIDHYDPDGDQQAIELSILYAWVTATLTNRNEWKIPAHLGVKENVIAVALQDWQAKLERYANGFQLEKDGTPFEESTFAGLLWQPQKIEGEYSDLFLQSTRLGERKVVVLSETLPADKRVYRGVFAGDVDVSHLSSEGALLETRAGYPVEVEYVVAERLFLPEKLVVLQLSAAAYRKTSATLSVPITPDFFRYFEHQDLVGDANRLTISKIGETHKVTLRLPVNGGTLTVERTYRDQDIVHLQKDTPGFAVWPDFQSPEWKQNFAAYAAPDVDDLIVKPVYIDGKQAEQEARINAHQKNVRIWPSDKSCIGFALEWHDSSNNELNAGMIIRNDLRPPKPMDSGTKWDVGVDFGTSSTTVMVSRNEAPAAPMQFKGRTVFLTEPKGDAKQFLRAIESSLYPSAGAAPVPPFRTLLYNSAATVFKLRASNYTLRFSGDASQDGVNIPVRNVKWGRQPSGDSPMMVYLEGLVRYIACEALDEGVKNLVFRWSYPLSLPLGSLTKMESFWSQQVASHYKSNEGMDVKVKENISESEAICRCLAAARDNPILNVRADGIAIAVDVGGGSTDIAIWSAQELLDQFSFKVAGNDILDPVYVGPAALQAIFEACWGRSIPAPELKTILGSPEVYVNGALAEARDHTGAVIQNPALHPLPRHIHGGKEEVEPWFHFRSMIYLCFTGLFYYLGTHVRIFDVELNNIEVYIGGRGSAGLTWLAANPKLTCEVLTDAFRRGLASNIPVGNQNPKKFRHSENANIAIRSSAIEHEPRFPALKTEVADGLLHELKLTVKTQPGVRLGEVGWRSKTGQQPEAWEQRMSAKQMAELLPPQNFESSHIGDFVNWVKDDTKKFLTRLNLDANLKNLWPDSAVIQNQIRQSSDDDEQVLQPIFGYEIKALMQQYAQRVAKSTAGQSSNT